MLLVNCPLSSCENECTSVCMDGFSGIIHNISLYFFPEKRKRYHKLSKNAWQAGLAIISCYAMEMRTTNGNGLVNVQNYLCSKDILPDSSYKFIHIVSSLDTESQLLIRSQLRCQLI